MIYAVVIVSALTTAGIVAAFVLVARWGFRAKDEAGRAADLYREQERRADSAMLERDEWAARHAVIASQLAASKTRLASAEASRNSATQAERVHVVETIRNATAVDAARLGNAVLSRPLPRMPQAGQAAASDGDRGAAGVSAAGIADGVAGGGRIPKP